MIARLFKIAFFTGAAHFFTIFALKFLSQNTSPGKISVVGELDSLFLLIISLLALGLQLSAVRDIASSEDWKKVYHETQVARISLACLLTVLSVLYFIDQTYIYFALAPVFALNGDYALYGRGKPVFASLLAFLRVSFPFLILIVFSIWAPEYLVWAYVISTVFIYWLTGVIIGKILQCSYWYMPNFASLLLYVKSMGLGIVALAYYFLGLGLLVVATPLFNEETLAIIYLGLKLYVIFKGLVRIITQAFFKEMAADVIGLKVDQLAICASVVFAACLCIFPDSFILIFFNQDYLHHKTFLLFVGVAAVFTSFGVSLTTRSILKQKDKPYTLLSVIVILTGIITIVLLSFFLKNSISIGIALVAGELILLSGLLSMNKDIDLKSRFSFLLRLCALLTIPVGIRIVAGDHFSTLFLGMSLFAIVAAYLLYRQFSSFNIKSFI